MDQIEAEDIKKTLQEYTENCTKGIFTTNLDSILKSRDVTLPTKVQQSYSFSSSYVWMLELDHK